MERLIEKYMSLPNQAWDNIVKEATRVSNVQCVFPFTTLKKKEGNWGKLTFAKTSGIITENTLVSYCPFFFFTVPSNSPRTLRKLAQSSFHLIYRVANSSYFLEMIQCT